MPWQKYPFEHITQEDDIVVVVVADISDVGENEFNEFKEFSNLKSTYNYSFR